MTNALGFYVPTMTTSTGSITNSYGFYMAPQPNVANPYGLFIDGAGAQNFIAGNTGIGTATPASRLSVQGDGSSDLLSLYSDTGSEQFTFTNGGSLGIGTSSPSSKLTVQGDGYFGGTLTATGTVRFSALGGGLLLTDALGNVATTATSSLGILLGDLGDVDTTNAVSGDLLSYTGSSWATTSTSTLGLGDGTFLGLSDTPGSYTNTRIPYMTASGLTTDGDFTFNGTRLRLGDAAAGVQMGEDFHIGSNLSNPTIGLAGDKSASIMRRSTATAGTENERAMYTMLHLDPSSDVASGRFQYSHSANTFINSDVTANFNNSIHGNSGIVTYLGQGDANQLTGSLGAVGIDTSSGNINSALGAQNYVTITEGTATGTVGTYSGVDITNGSIQSAYGGYANIYTLGSGLIDEAAGYYVESFAAGGGGTINDVYGLFIQPQTAGSNSNYGVYAAGTTTNYFGGSLGLGTTTPSSKLTIRATGTDNLLSLHASSGTEALTVTGEGRLGLGTSSPWANLAVVGESGQLAPLFSVASSSNDSFVHVTNEGLLGLGTTTPRAQLSLGDDATGEDGFIGLDQLYTVNPTGGGTQYANFMSLQNEPTGSANTLVGQIIRVTDDTALANTVRALEVQAQRGGNSQGENTAISGFGRTFGVRAVTEGDAGNTFVPAGLFAESKGDTQGNAIRAFSSTLTDGELVYLFQESTTFAGTGLRMNLGVSGGFTGDFLDLQVGGVSRFLIASTGSTTIGDGSTQAGLAIGFGGLCVDNDGSCSASTTGRISYIDSYVGNSDLAERYFSEDDLSPGEIVMTEGGLTVTRAQREGAGAVVGVVSTKPGIMLGADDASTGGAGYPIGLVGRVPVLVSTENGAIEPGDRITLSSLSGIGMNATGTGATIVGVALEPFDENSDFESPLTAAMIEDGEPRPELNPARITQGSDRARVDGGVALNEEDTRENPGQEVVTVPRPEAPEQKHTTFEDAERRTTPAGEEVTVGKVMVFINLGIYDPYAFDRIDPTAGETDGLLASLRSALGSLGITVSQGLIEARELVAGVLRADKVETDGIEMRDQETGEVYCVVVSGGELVHEPGPCGASGSASGESAREAAAGSGGGSTGAAPADEAGDVPDSAEAGSEDAAAPATPPASTTASTSDETETATTTTGADSDDGSAQQGEEAGTSSEIQNQETKGTSSDSSETASEPDTRDTAEKSAEDGAGENPSGEGEPVGGAAETGTDTPETSTEGERSGDVSGGDASSSEVNTQDASSADGAAEAVPEAASPAPEPESTPDPAAESPQSGDTEVPPSV
jgi:ABC-type cobalt transport system substrate-binding protein